jgi:transcriptional regulator
VVPTWNYAVVHASGTLQVHDDPVWVRAQLHQLVDQHEARFAKPWGVDDAPRDYTDRLISAIVGIEIPITQLTGKWKVSQNQPTANQTSVVQGLQAQPGDEAVAMAALVKQYGAA